MTAAARRAVVLAGTAALAPLLAWGVSGLPDFGHYPGPYGGLAIAASVVERHIANAPTGVVFDIRGFDTLVEELILFAAVTAVALLLRPPGGREPRPTEDENRDDELRALALLAVPPTLVVGLLLVAYGHVTPGGGFQGGAVVGSAFALVAIGAGSRELDRLAPHDAAEGMEGAALAGFATVGLIALAVAGAYLENVLPDGTLTSLASGGIVPLLDVLTGIAVGAGVVLLLREFLEELLLEHGR